LVIGSLLSEYADGQVLQETPAALQGIDVVEHLGDDIPLGLGFTDESGRKVTLQDYADGTRPVILVLAYYECPMLCTLVLNGIAKAAKELAWVPGNEFRLLTVSIDPSETVQLAWGKKERYLKFLDKPGAENGWNFLVGDSLMIAGLAESIGFKYFYDETRDEFAHPAVVTILTPQGRISRYLYGIEYKERDVRLALVEASDGKIGTTLDRLILYCYHYDPAAKGYVLFAQNVMRAGGVLTLVLLVLFVGLLWRRERRKNMNEVSPSS
jgi:protein SCO1/2